MRKSHGLYVSGLLILLSMFCVPTFGQVPTGTPPFGSFGGGPDVINLANLNAHLTVPVQNKAGRGLPFYYDLTYDSSVWYPVTSGSTTTWTPVNYWGWNVQTAVTTGYVNYRTLQSYCRTGTEITGTQVVFSAWSYNDQFGVTHNFIGTSRIQTGTCGNSITGMNALATDGSGYTLTSGSGNGNVQITSRAGKVVNPPTLTGSGAGTVTDRNGNQISVNSSGQFTDTLGQSALAVSQSAPGPSTPTTFTYTAPSGASANYTMRYTAFTVKTNFGCSVSEYSASNVALVTEIDLPDQSSNPSDKFTFTYETTPGDTHSPHYVTARLASITLPSGGQISYLYPGSNNGIECVDGSAAGLTRTTPDGVWSYVRSAVSPPTSTTTVTDPQSNQTVFNFQGIYETERQIIGAGTTLKTVFTCYNGSSPNCNATPITPPITQRAKYFEWPGGLESETNVIYNSYGLTSEKDEYAYGTGGSPGPLLRKTLTAYANLGNGIYNRPSSVQVLDGAGNLKSRTTYSYDGATVTSTSGTPQHVAVSGARGNATSVYNLVGSTSLNKSFTFYDTGLANTTTDVNGASTTLNYGTGSCGNSFPTSISEPQGLTKSFSWNCVGGVETSVIDENGQQTSFGYTQDSAFWRSDSRTDPNMLAENLTYTGTTTAEAGITYNGGNSTWDLLNNSDGLGRMHLVQLEEAPGSTTYDTVETDYDSLGRKTRVTLPFSAAAGGTSATAPAVTTGYDALGRKLTVTDAGGKNVTFVYNQNDKYRTIGPSPAGENTKRVQFEYDALGRISSVCEITTLGGSASCGQTNPASGFVTQYSYDILDNLIGVTQNAQSSGTHQTRTYAYDGVGRLISETNPESLSTTYTYDSDTTCGNSPGDLVKKQDAVGNVICFSYDSLHRRTKATYSGPYAANTETRYFVYDGATVNGVVMTNAKSRLAEAYTCASSCTPKRTDIGFSYSAVGLTTNTYELTPDSGSYYHVSVGYHPNGAIASIGSLSGLPSITYNVDGKGRINSVTAGQTLVSATSYNPADLPTQITLGSLDTDSATYDPNTNRMTQYKFTVNGQSVAGLLTWNAISTLQKLVVTDAFYGAGNQTCAYLHDDLSRVSSVNCGSPWNQTFSYDAFGNIQKSGTVSFQPSYSLSTNQISNVGGSTPVYDNNGDVESDTSHTYVWDANGRPVSIDGIKLVYDALGRMVEQNRANVYSEIVYSPTGAKLAIMNGQTLQKGFVPLVGGSSAVYNSGGLAYYRHPDWLGSSRFASTPGRSLYFDGAYAPFGEVYAQTGTSDLSFTGMNQDTVSNLFDFPTREYNPIHGRWASPDPAGLSSAQLNDPQTFNRYAYARNSPLSVNDPTGMFILPDCGADDDDDGGLCAGGGDGDDDSDGDWVDTGGGDDNGDDNGDDSQNSCDAACMQQQQEQLSLQTALAALSDPACGEAVDGGTGTAAATLILAGTAAANLTLGTISDESMDRMSLATATPNTSIYGLPTTSIKINTNPEHGFFNLVIPIPGYPEDNDLDQEIAILHELGHAAANAGIPSAVQNDAYPNPQGSNVSFQNSQNIADACVPQGDGGQNPGEVDDPGPVDAARKARKKN
jgi:RHS repeat-associated protein